MSSPAAPVAIRDWVSKPPSWLSVERVPDTPPPHVEEPDLGRLHAGERAAILLAERTGADLLLIDEKAARSVAEKRGLRVTGLLGVVSGRPVPCSSGCWAGEEKAFGASSGRAKPPFKASLDDSGRGAHPPPGTPA